MRIMHSIVKIRLALSYGILADPVTNNIHIYIILTLGIANCNTHMNSALSLMNNSKLAATANRLHIIQKNIAPPLCNG